MVYKQHMTGRDTQYSRTYSDYVPLRERLAALLSRAIEESADPELLRSPVGEFVMVHDLEHRTYERAFTLIRQRAEAGQVRSKDHLALVKHMADLQKANDYEGVAAFVSALNTFGDLGNQDHDTGLVRLVQSRNE
jgi:hypothetical protein